MNVISVEALSKRYVLDHAVRHDTLRDTLAAGARSMWNRLGGKTQNTTSQEDFWALRDVSFSVGQGEVVGIIGRNGAGKSTLLKILSRITEATTGRVRLRGRVASLLEVGTGFHPELTGRDNIFLNGAILGMKRAEIRAKFDEIVAFAEVERFLDTPVKRYSSGMYVRLAFAVAAHLEPEILIVDEVLAVGDAAFQKKCLGKMHVAASHGRTVLFVSHNMVAVQSLCRRALLLREGRIMLDGSAGDCVARYLQQAEPSPSARTWSNPADAPGTAQVRLRHIAIRPTENTASGAVTMRTPFAVELGFWAQSQTRITHWTIHLLNDSGLVVLTTGSPPQNYPPGMHTATCRFPGNLLNSGSYTVKLLLVENETQAVFTVESAASFTVTDAAERDHAYFGREPGVVQPRLRWRIEVGSPEIAE